MGVVPVDAIVPVFPAGTYRHCGGTTTVSLTAFPKTLNTVRDAAFFSRGQLWIGGRHIALVAR